MTDPKPTRVTIWNEYVHERNEDAVRAIYPDGIHQAIAAGIVGRGALKVRTATLDQPFQGVPDEMLEATDTLVWWGHVAHDQVTDDTLDRVHRQVLGGMGLIVLHSGHFSRIFRRLMGTSCSLSWRESTDHERLWNLRPDHPVLEGVGDYVELAAEEMYGERFDIPEPHELLMIGWFTGGEVFRSLCTWTRGLGRVVYFQPGHETYPTYHDPVIQQVIANACVWARRRETRDMTQARHTEALEPLPASGHPAP
jgi:trehalose utilization protein